MDREQAKRDLGVGLWLGLLATGLFAFVFFVATLYIASA